jgi:hypothetical protein
MAGGDSELAERNDEFSLTDPLTWLKEVEVGDGKTVNVPVMLLIAEGSDES